MDSKSNLQISALEQRIKELEDQLAASEKRTAELNTAERRSLESKAQDTSVLLQSLLDALPVFISYVDTDYKYKFVNHLYEAWLGKSRAEIEGQYVRDIVGNIPYQYAESYLKRCLAGETVNYEINVDEVDGQHNYDVVNVSDIQNGDVKGVFVLVTDTSRHKLDEQMLKDSEDTKDALLNAVEETLLLLDIDRNILAVNRTAAERYGRSPAEMKGKCIDEFLPTEIAEQRAVYAEDVINHCAPVEFEDERNDKQYKTRVYPVLDSGGKVSKLAVYARDITESNTVMNDLIQARDQAEAANEAKSRFLARMSHELRTPLNSIIGYAQLFEIKNKQLKLPQHKYVSEILKASRHLLQLITDLLDLSKIEVNKVELSLVSVDAMAAVEGSIATIMPLVDERKITISYEPVQCNDTWIYADPVRLKQVLLNLLSNAVKYNREAGSINIVCEKTWGHRLRISMTDTGPGIQQKELENVFDPFNRLYLETYAAQGAGIGLSLSKHLIELMHGRIGVDSVYGKGCTFWIELNLAKQRPAEMQYSATFDDNYGASSRSTLMYVEDSPAHMSLVEDILETMPDIRFIGANTPMLGLELARTHKPDIILLDICLPGMDGYEFFEHLQKQKGCRHIPVIGLSASALSEEIEKGLRLGFRRYLTKPVDIPHFKKVIKEILRDSEVK